MVTIGAWGRPPDPRRPSALADAARPWNRDRV